VLPVVATVLSLCCWFCCQFFQLKLLDFNNVASVASFQTSYINRCSENEFSRNLFNDGGPIFEQSSNHNHFTQLPNPSLNRMLETKTGMHALLSAILRLAKL
jgi:hypothetical protein